MIELFVYLNCKLAHLIHRILLNTIKDKLYKGKAIILTGPRQTGKTTLVREISRFLGDDHLWFNGDDPDVIHTLQNVGLGRLKQVIGEKKCIIIDEAQRIENIGLTVKLITDSLPDVQVIVTGSSAFELSNKMSEPLTGRKWEYMLFPISYEELVSHHGFLEEAGNLETRLVYGYYPEVVTSIGNERETLKSISDSYLFRDILAWQQIRKSDKLENLLRALAFQVGNEVSYNELSQLVQLDKDTVEKYITILEKAYVVFRLPALSRNLRNEIKRSRKVYFYDNGIRNAVIGNFNAIPNRQDVGALWENFLVSGRFKWNRYHNFWGSSYFWRTHAQQEIDYVEEIDGAFQAWEFKWGLKRKKAFPKSFLSSYSVKKTSIITRENYQDFLLLDMK